MKKRILGFGIIGIIGIAAVTAAFLPGISKSDEACEDALMSFRGPAEQVDAAAINDCVNSVVSNIDDAIDNVNDAENLDDATKTEVVSILSSIQDLVRTTGEDAQDGDVNMRALATEGKGVYMRLWAVYEGVKDDPAALEELEVALEPVFGDFEDEGGFERDRGHGKGFGEFGFEGEFKDAEWDELQAGIQEAKDAIAEIEGLDASVAGELNGILDDASALAADLEVASEDDDFAFIDYIERFADLAERAKALMENLDEETKLQLGPAMASFLGGGEHGAGGLHDGGGCSTYGDGYSFGFSHGENPMSDRATGLAGAL